MLRHLGLVLCLCMGLAAAWGQEGAAGRLVRQTVFTEEGTPAAGSKVWASYAWHGMATLTSAVADARGVVAWKDLPPVRVITWGDTVTAGVIPADATVVTAPLPFPLVDTKMPLSFVLDTRGQELPPSYWSANSGREWFGNNQAWKRPGTERIEVHPAANIYAGCRYSLVGATKTDPFLVCYLRDVFAPYADDAPATLALTLQPGIVLTGRLQDKAGKPVGRVQHFDLQPTDDAGDVPAVGRTVQEALQILQATLNPDGTFTARLPAPGRYALEVDLYDDTVEPPPGLLLQVGANQAPVTVTLPDPLVTVPCGADFNWLLRSAPQRPQRITVSAFSPTVPLYGPREQLLTYWYRPSPNTLAVWDPAKGAEVNLPLRTVFLQPRQPDGQPYTRDIRIAPLLPVSLDERWRVPYAPTAAWEMQSFLFNAETESRVQLWAGRYLVTDAFDAKSTNPDAPPPAVLGVLDIPAAGPPVIPLSLKMPSPATPATVKRPVALTFPEDNYLLWKTAASMGMLATFDVPGETVVTLPSTPLGDGKGRTTTILAPMAAKTMTLRWLGRGVMRNVPITGDAVTLPAWEDGVKISGKILQPDGTPGVNMSLTAGRECAGNIEQFLWTTTGADGSFTVRGIAPGVICIWLKQESNNPGWALQVPEAGLAGLTLRMLPKPFGVNMRATAGIFNALWWIPRQGPPRPISGVGHNCYSYEVPRTPGTLWLCDRTKGSAELHSLAPMAEGHDVRQSDDPQPSVGIYMPIDPEAGLPGSITLAGTGTLKGLSVTFRSPFWQPFLLPNLYLAQISAVPPGTYTVSVVTARGTVEQTLTVARTGGVAVFPGVQ